MISKIWIKKLCKNLYNFFYVYLLQFFFIVLELIMDIKCKTNPYYFLTPSPMETTYFRGAQSASRVVERACVRINAGAKNGINAGLCEDILVRRPVANKSATGLLGLMSKCKESVASYCKNYKKNLSHTYDHKKVFALVEKELFGNNSIDSLTHDLDKLVLYTLGFPKSFVSKFHRQISVHHTESGKNMNLRSMLCDNIASSPEFKPEKKKSLREHFNTSAELQSVPGFREILEKYNYGENLDFDAIKARKELSFAIPAPIMQFARVLCCFFF